MNSDLNEAGYDCAGLARGSGSCCPLSSCRGEPTALVPVAGGGVETADGWAGLAEAGGGTR